MKFYIASGFANKDLVRYVSRKLISEGHTHTYDWTVNKRATDSEQLKQIGNLEKQAVADCDVFIILLPAGKGSHTELGMALEQIYIYSADELNPATASTFYFIDGVKRVYGEIDSFIKGIMEEMVTST